jgi:hypothetical protein
MKIIHKLLRLVVSAPVVTYKNGHVISSFNRYTYWAYPVECKANFELAMSTCEASTQKRQRSMLAAYFGPALGE